MKKVIPKRRILIVDDDPIYRDSLRLMFPALESVEAGTVEEALGLLQKNPDLQVVILDLDLGQSKGTSLLEAIKHRMEHYRVIVLTGREELLGADEAKVYGVFSYVVKTDRSFRQALLFHINDAFTAIERAWLTRKVDVHLEIVRKVNHLGVGANADADRELREVLDLISDRAVELLGAYTCHIRLLDPGRGDFVLWASRGRLPSAASIFDERVPLKRAYSGLAADTRERIIVPDLQKRRKFKDMKAEAFRDPDLDPGYREYLDNVRSACIDPISTGIYGEDIDAIFNINHDEEGFFSTAEKLELVDDFVSQTNLAITKYRLKKKRRDIHDDYRNIGDMLADISQVFIAGEDELETIYKIVFKRISFGLGPEIISIFLFDETVGQLRNVAEFRGDTWVGPMDERYRPDVGIVGRVYSSGKTKLFSRRQDEETGQTDESSLPEGYAEENIKNIPSGVLKHYLAVPITFNNDTIGVIRAVNKKSEQYDLEPEKTKSTCLLKRGFSEDCETELEITANHLAATIKNAELIGELNKAAIELNAKVRQIESIYTVGQMIGFGQDMNVAFDLIVESVVEIMHAEICMLFQMNERGDRIDLTQSSGMPLIDGAYYDLGEGKTGLVAQTGEVILEAKAQNHRGKYDAEIIAFLRRKHNSNDKGIESFMAVPLVAKGRILGVIKVINKVEPPFEFEKKDLDLFQLFDSQIGLERFLYTQRYLKNVVENSPVPIIFLNQQGKVGIFNKACEQLWGVKSEDAINKSVIDFYISEAQARAIGKKLWESEDHRIHNIEAQIKGGDGVAIPVLLSANFLFDGERRIGSMGVFKDLRDIRKYQDQAKRTEWDANIGRLADIVSHNTQTTIAAARLHLDRLKEKTEGLNRGDLTSLCTHIEDALSEALDNLMGLTRSPQPTAPVIQLLSVKELFEGQILESLKREATRSDVGFVVDYSSAQASSVEVDAGQIEEVIKNLFNNSLDAIKNRRRSDASLNGLIEVSATREGDRLNLIWRDNGCGIDKAKISRIFELYYTDGKREGTGLGLFRVEKIIQNHNGKVEVTSVEGEGTTFVVTLPVQA